MPKPNPKESRSDFLRRCIPELMNEGKEQDQAVAICIDIYKRSKKKNE
jgi:hypothetical protein